jgi:hypothetical protein
MPPSKLSDEYFEASEQQVEGPNPLIKPGKWVEPTIVRSSSQRPEKAVTSGWPAEVEEDEFPL